tara:strand:+ start:338 stop:565 length:228 start_codon:yes stop_codon:yes gene_type:complete
MQAGSDIRPLTVKQEASLYSDDYQDKLLDVVVAARRALWKLDIEFNREPGVEHLEGWAEANQLRRSLKALDTIDA